MTMMIKIGTMIITVQDGSTLPSTTLMTKYAVLFNEGEPLSMAEIVRWYEDRIPFLGGWLTLTKPVSSISKSLAPIPNSDMSKAPFLPLSLSVTIIMTSSRVPAVALSGTEAS